MRRTVVEPVARTRGSQHWLLGVDTELAAELPSLEKSVEKRYGILSLGLVSYSPNQYKLPFPVGQTSPRVLGGM